jgi:hypothetical protein
MSKLRFAITAVMALLVSAGATASPGTTRQVCVICQAPDAIYRCVLDSPGKQPRKSLSLFCAARIAEEHDHASCSVVQRAKCDGLEKIYSIDDVEAGLELGPVGAAPLEATDPRPVPGVGGEQPTLSQAARENAEQSAKATARASHMLGEVARRTWTCLNTLGREC